VCQGGSSRETQFEWSSVWATVDRFAVQCDSGLVRYRSRDLGHPNPWLGWGATVMYGVGTGTCRVVVMAGSCIAGRCWVRALIHRLCGQVCPSVDDALGGLCTTHASGCVMRMATRPQDVVITQWDEPFHPRARFNSDGVNRGAEGFPVEKHRKGRGRVA
jgi:hypothetical protein